MNSIKPYASCTMHVIGVVYGFVGVRNYFIKLYVSLCNYLFVFRCWDERPRFIEILQHILTFYVREVVEFRFAYLWFDVLSAAMALLDAIALHLSKLKCLRRDVLFT